MRHLAVAIPLILLGMLSAQPAIACGPETDCRIGDRHYRIALPEDAAGPVGAIVYAHGYRGSAAAVMRNRGLRRAVSEMGLALIALKSADEDWVIPHAPGHVQTDGKVEFDYVAAVIVDAAQRFPLDTDRLMAAGFSAGGMLVWNLACTMPDRFAGFAAISGTFWLEAPETCARPAASLVHIHGTDDPVVPLEGRPIRETRQGDVVEVIEMYARFGAFRPAGRRAPGGLDCRRRRNAAGAILDLCLHPGGHSFRAGYLGVAWDRLREAGQL